MSDARWNDLREYDDRARGDGRPRVHGGRDRDDLDPRDSLINNLDLPRGEERELVLHRDSVYELNGEDCHTLAVVGAFRVVPEQDLDTEHDTLRHLRDEGLVETVDLGGGEFGLTLTKEGRNLLDSHSLERDGGTAAFAQFDNDVRSDRTRAGMRTALELGRWTFPAPLGYLNAPKWSKTSLVQRSGTRAAGEARIRGSRVGQLHEAGSHRARDRSGTPQPKRPAAVATDLRANDAESDIRRTS